MPATPFRVISFDCFGTLVDARAGLRAALAGEIPGAGSRIELLLGALADRMWEALEELEEFRPHRDLLAGCLVEAGRAAGLELPADAAARVAASCGSWPLYPDAPAALATLAGRWPIAVISNAGAEDLGRIVARLGVAVAKSISSDHVGSFKPEPDHFLALLHEMELDEEQLLHVSASPEFDLQTVEDLGIPRAYVDRDGRGLPEEITATLRFRDLGGLARRLVEPARRGPSRGRAARPGRGGGKT
ncbi:MAG: HAD family hydrolase [Acidobacteria bacterium]|nr:HAD family hydrolase [Acidobacteriota bacterium]